MNPCGICAAFGPAENREARRRGWHYSDTWAWVCALCVLRVPGLEHELRTKYRQQLRAQLQKLPAQLDLSRKLFRRRRSRRSNRVERSAEGKRQQLDALVRLQFDLEKVLDHSPP